MDGLRNEMRGMANKLLELSNNSSSNPPRGMSNKLRNSVQSYNPNGINPIGGSYDYPPYQSFNYNYNGSNVNHGMNVPPYVPGAAPTMDTDDLNNSDISAIYDTMSLAGNSLLGTYPVNSSISNHAPPQHVGGYHPNNNVDMDDPAVAMNHPSTGNNNIHRNGGNSGPNNTATSVDLLRNYTGNLNANGNNLNLTQIQQQNMQQQQYQQQMLQQQLQMQAEQRKQQLQGFTSHSQPNSVHPSNSGNHSEGVSQSQDGKNHPKKKKQGNPIQGKKVSHAGAAQSPYGSVESEEQEDDGSLKSTGRLSLKNSTSLPKI